MLGKKLQERIRDEWIRKRTVIPLVIRRITLLEWKMSVGLESVPNAADGGTTTREMGQKTNIWRVEIGSKWREINWNFSFATVQTKIK